MRKYILLFIALCLHIAARGQTITSLEDIDLSGLPQPTQTKALRYWFDDDTGSVQTLNRFTGQYALDVSSLTEGLHTLHFQVTDTEDRAANVRSGLFLKVAQHSESMSVKSMHYWFDDDASSVQTADGTTGTYLLDVSMLIEGLHTLHYQLTDESNVTAYVGSAIFLKADSKENETTAKSLRYWFDDEEVSTESILSGGICTIDVSTLLDGLHTIHYQVAGNDVQVYYVASAIFLKTSGSLGSETVSAKKLMYWFDDDTSIQLLDISEGVQLLNASELMEGLHTLHYQVLCSNGQMTPAMSSLFLRISIDVETAVAKSFRYWFDDEQTATEVEIIGGIQMLDASRLIEGLHTVHYQIANSNGTLGAPTSSIFLKINWETASTTAKDLRYWFDDETAVTETAVANGTQALNVSHLIEGLHTVHYQIVDSNGTLGAPASSVFLKMDYDNTTATAKSIRYWFDDDASTVRVTDWANGTQTLDVSDLLTGLHTLNYQLIDSNGRVGVPVTRLFMKNFDKVLADGHNRVTKYQYWLNTNSQAMKSVTLDAAANPYTLISLLPMQKEPIHSDCFHFEMTNDVPTIYAKNILHVRFYDAQNYFTDGEKPFVDYSVKQDVVPAGELQSTQTFDKVAENVVRWYTMQVAPGDTAAFRLSQPATVQVFAPSGAEVFKTSESASVKWGGIHTWEDGTYYLAVHDVTGSQSTMKLEYMHMDKYDVVDWDVHTVGNGGCSTITFKGNGFSDLYAVDLVIAPGDTIHSVDVSHDNDAETAVTFDFTNAALGEYNAVFHFTEEDKPIANVVIVEEATEFDFAMSYQFANPFLFSSGNTYTFTIENKGNMTAYDVPLPVLIYVPKSSSLSRVDVGGFSFKDYFKKVNGGIFNPRIAEKQITSGDLCFFINDSTTQIPGFPYVYYAYIRKTLPPNSSKVITVKVKTSTDVHVYMDYPEIWPELSSEDAETPERFNAPPKRLSQRCLLAQSDLAKCYEDDAREQNDEERIYYSKEWCAKRKLPKGCPPPPNGDYSRGVNSFDPNDIFGYLSEAGSKFIADSVARVNYTIEFENDTTFAEAAAHTIVIRDTLDSQHFDLTKFMPTGIRIGEHETFLDEADVVTRNNVTSFVKTIDMRPEINAIAQVDGTFNQTTHIAEWTIQSLDPMTMEPTDDLMQGILPVNYDGTSGIGEVMFEVGVKSGKADGTEIANRAGIVFDYEEAILTPTWTNIVDGTDPRSRVTDVHVLSDSTATVIVEANDELSGPWRYNVYVQYGTGAWFLAAENVAADTTATVKIYEGIEHHFYCVATDMAGNVEQKEPTCEVSMTMNTVFARGDVNGDHVVDALDASLILQYVAHKFGDENTNFIKAAADTNNDNVIDALDASLVLQHAAKKINLNEINNTTE